MAMYTVDVYSGSSDSIIRDPHAQGVIIKATQSTGYVNPRCNHQYALAKSLGKKLGLYHYAGGGNPEAEAQYFVNNIRNYVGSAILVLDWESYQNASWGSTTWARRYVNEVHRLTGVWPLIYVQESALWQVASCASDCGLWVAKYASMTWYSWSVPNMSVASGAFHFITGWQFTGGDMDRSIFYIDGAAWDRLANPNAHQPAAVTRSAYLDSVNFNGGALNISGWFGSDKSGNKPYRYIIITSKDYKHEYGRVRVNPGNRPDVPKVYPKLRSDIGFTGAIPYTGAMAGQACKIIFRYTDDPAGNGNADDWSFDHNFTTADAWLDGVNAINDRLTVSGWFATDYAINYPYRFIILWDNETKRELGRYVWKPIERDDVQTKVRVVYGTKDSGFSIVAPYDNNLVGHSIQVIARYSDDKAGEGHYKDYWFSPVKYPEHKLVKEAPKSTVQDKGTKLVQPTQVTKSTNPVKPTQPIQPTQPTQASAKTNQLLVKSFKVEATAKGIQLTYQK